MNVQRLVEACVVLASSVTIPAAIRSVGRAGATAGFGANATTVASGTTSDQVHVEATGDTGIVFQRVTLQPGGVTGWHYHPGPSLVVVEAGTLTHYDDRCGARTYDAGQAFEEAAGAEHVHMGANRGDVAVVLEVTYIVPSGSPLRVDAPGPLCALAG